MATQIPEISIAPEVVTQIGPVAITNTMLGTLVASLILVVIAIIIRRKAGVVPSRAQMAFESVMNFFMNILEKNLGEKRARKFFPLLFTLFLFLIIANQFSFIPFIESIVLQDTGASVFRTPTTDFSLPIAFAIMILGMANLMAFAISPIRHIGNFIKLDVFFKIKSVKELPMAMIEFMLGLMDIIGEVAKLVSISVRLFGNILSGQIMFMVISGLFVYVSGSMSIPVTGVIAPLPFLALSTLSGFIQAFIFAMLSTAYLASSLDGVAPDKKELQPAH